MKSAVRKPRSDAAKNRELLIDAAKNVLGQGGPGASLEAVAREAGVGIGTLYRHFPNREALFGAVYRHEVEDLIRLAEALRQDADRENALRLWVFALVDLVQTKRGLLGTLGVVATENTKAIYAELSGRLAEAVGQLLKDGIGASVFRAEITAEDLLTSIYAFCYARQPGPEWKASVLRLVEIFLDGVKAP